HAAGIAVVLEGTGFPSDNIVEMRTQAIVAFLGPVAGPASVVECFLLRLGGSAIWRRGRRSRFLKPFCPRVTRQTRALQMEDEVRASLFPDVTAPQLRAVLAVAAYRSFLAPA